MPLLREVYDRGTNERLPDFDDGLVFGETTNTFTATYDPDTPESFVGIGINDMWLYPIGNDS